MPRLCSLDGCDKAFRARGLCGTHYNQQHQPNRHRKVEVNCDWCGKGVLKDVGREKRYANLYCGEDCRDASRRESTRLRHSQVVRYTPRPVWHKFIHLLDMPPAQTQRVFVSGQCKKCGEWFTDRQVTAVFCSALCSRRWHRDERKARMGYVVPNATRVLVYQRDNGTCQICLGPVDMQLPAGSKGSPTLDHIIPQSWTLIPNHEPENLRLAHMLCNALRGDARTEQVLAA